MSENILGIYYDADFEWVLKIISGRQRDIDWSGDPPKHLTSFVSHKFRFRVVRNYRHRLFVVGDYEQLGETWMGGTAQVDLAVWLVETEYVGIVVRSSETHGQRM